MEEKKKNNYYITNAEIMPEIMHYKKTGEATENFGRQIMKIARNLSNLSRWSQYTWKEDMIADAVLTCIKRCKNFDPERTENPYSYLTSICWNAFRNYLNKQKKHAKIKDSCYKITLSEFPEQIDDKDLAN